MVFDGLGKLEGHETCGNGERRRAQRGDVTAGKDQGAEEP